MRFLAPWLIVTVLWTGAAMAQDAAGVTCVQEQMVAAGFDPGSVDGYPGRRTRAAIAAFAEARGKETLSLPTLTQHNGAVLCRLIGLADTSLQAQWPATRDPIQIIAAPSIHSNVQGAVYTMARETLRRFIVDYDIRLAMPIRIILSEGEVEFALMMNENSGGELRNLSERASYHCNAGGGVSGVTYGDLIGICLLSDQELGRGVSLGSLNAVVAHEIVHSAQRQLAGRPARNGSFQDFVDHRGPLWLTEGTATIIAEEITSPGVLTSGYVRYLEDELVALGWPDLAQMELRPTSDHTTSQMYTGGAVAVGRLLSPTAADLELIFRFYERIGLGGGWQSAFVEQFGQPSGDMYQAFLALNPRLQNDEAKPPLRP